VPVDISRISESKQRLSGDKSTILLSLSLPATEVKTLPTLLKSKTGGLLDKATGKSEASKSHGKWQHDIVSLQ
jgi:hypothetical protein